MAELGDIIAGAASRYGVDPQTMLRIAQIESSMNPSAKNPSSSAGGLYQFIDGTAKQYGLANRFDPGQASDAAARLARDNAAFLRQRIGRDPTGGELYLAHQQGAGGAAKILANPNAPAASIVGERAVTLNGGRPGMTAAQFAGLWLNKFDKTPGRAVAPGAAPAQPQMQVAQAPMAPMQPPAIPQAALASMFAMNEATAKREQEARAEADRARRLALFGGDTPFS